LISAVFDDAYETNPLPGRILEAVKTNGNLKEITVAEYKK